MNKNILRLAILFFIFAIAVRLFILVILLNYEGPESLILGDTTRYLGLARNMIVGDGYQHEGLIEAFRPPGYSIYLFLFEYFKIPLLFAVIIQIFIASLIPALILLFVLYLKLPLWIGTVSATLFIIEPVAIYYGIMLMPDTFSIVLFLLTILFLAKWMDSLRFKWILLAALALGFSNYFRPAGLYFAIFVVIGMIFYFWKIKKVPVKQYIAYLILFLAVSSAILAPWCARNYVHFGSFSFVSAPAVTLYESGAAAAISIEEKQDFAMTRNELREKAGREAPDPLNIKSLRNEEYLIDKAIEIIKKYPVGYIKAYLLGVNTFLFSSNYNYLLYRYGIIKMPSGRGLSFSLIFASSGLRELFTKVGEYIKTPYVWVAAGGRILWLILVLGSLAGALKFRKTSLGFLFLISMLYSVLTILSLAIAVEARHRTMLNPFIFIFFLAAAKWMYNKFIKKAGAPQQANDIEPSQ